MKPAPFRYEAARTLDGALRLLAEADAKALAGGQSLVPLLNFRLARPSLLVDLNPIAALAYLRRSGGVLRIGALTRQASLERSGLVARYWPLLRQAVTMVGHPAIRSRGTVGGSVAHADPSAELPVALAALDARFHLRSPRGERTVGASELFRGPMMTAIEADELLTEIEVPAPPAGARMAFVEHARTHGDFALAGAAVVLAPGRVRRDRPARGRAHSGPRRCGRGRGAARRGAAGSGCAGRSRGSRRVPARAAHRAGQARSGAGERVRIAVEINGSPYEAEVESRTLLSDFIRHQAGLTGTHVGCEHGVCGACTVQLDGEPVRSCLMLAVQAGGRAILTVEGLAGPGGELTALQRAFTEHHALQCGFCTAGFLLTAEALLRRHPDAGEAQIREELAGNLCRCTGYEGIVAAVRAVAVEAGREAAQGPLG